MSWNNQTKNSTTFSNRTQDFPGTYSIARYGISTYGTATAGDGGYSKQTKNSSTFTNITKH